MTAEEARALTYEANLAKDEKRFKEVERDIERAACSGKFAILVTLASQRLRDAIDEAYTPMGFLVREARTGLVVSWDPREQLQPKEY